MPSDSSSDQVAAIIVNWNASHDTLTVARWLGTAHPGARIYVIDNASEDEDRRHLRQHLADSVTLIEKETNDGYAAGVNTGIRLARACGARYGWLLNPDSLPTAACLPALLAGIENAVAVGPRQYQSDSPDDPGQTYVSAATISQGRVTPVKCGGCVLGVHDVDIVTGTGLLVDLDACAVAGPLREEFFHYKEEFEFIERLGQVGSIRHVCSATVWHRRGGALSHESQAAQYYRVRNELLYLSMRERHWRLTGRALRFIFKSLYEARRGRRAIVLRAAFDAYRNRTGRVTFG